MKVWLIKPALDIRDGADVIRSRIGLEERAHAVTPDVDLYLDFAASHRDCHVIIADECQFFTSAQVDQLRKIVDELDIPVLCFGLRTDFLTHMFEGSHRLFEVADSISEIKTICTCGKKAIVNARIDCTGHIVTEGAQVVLGGNDSYIAMCHRCYETGIREHKVIKLHGQD